MLSLLDLDCKMMNSSGLFIISQDLFLPPQLCQDYCDRTLTVRIPTQSWNPGALGERKAPGRLPGSLFSGPSFSGMGFQDCVRILTTCAIPF